MSGRLFDNKPTLTNGEWKFLAAIKEEEYIRLYTNKEEISNYQSIGNMYYGPAYSGKNYQEFTIGGYYDYNNTIQRSKRPTAEPSRARPLV